MKGRENPFYVTPKTSVSRLVEADAQEISKGKNVMADISVVKTFFKPHVGQLLWLLKTRFSLSYAIIEISTNVETSLVESKDTLKLTKSINNVTKKAKSNEIKNTILSRTLLSSVYVQI